MKKINLLLFVIFSFSLFTVLLSSAKVVHLVKKPVSPVTKKSDDNTIHPIKKDIKDPHKYVAENGLYRAEFTNEGIKFIKKHRVSRKAGSSYSFGYQLETIKIGDKVLWKLKDKAKIQPEIKKPNKQVTYALTDNIKEVYEAKKSGIEQSWVISEKPSYLSELKSPEKTGLIIEGRISTDLKTRRNRKGRIDFIDKKGRNILSYGKVTVKDSKGKTLKVSPSLSSIDKDTPSIKILISAEWLKGAEYPVIIDPFIGDIFYGNEILIGSDLTKNDQDNR